MLSKNKINLLLVAIVLLVMPCLILFAGCGNEIKQLTNNEYNIVLESKGFENGTIAKVQKLEKDSESWGNSLSLINNQKYNKTKDPVMYDIHIEKDGMKLQPKKEVKITINAPYESSNSFVIFHIKSDNSVESLETTYNNGKINFNTNSFSVFIIIEDEESGEINIHYDNTMGTIKLADNSVMPKDFEVSLKGENNIKLTATAKAGYKFVGWYNGNDENAELITSNPTAYFTRFNTLVYAKFDAGELESFFLFELEMAKVNKNDSNIKTVAYYSTNTTDGKVELLRAKIDGSFDNENKAGIDVYDTGMLIKSATCYKDCVVGTRAQKRGNVYGYYTYDGTFNAKLSINDNYLLFYVENDVNLLTTVKTDKYQTLREGRYFVVRKDAYNSAIASGKSKDSAELYLSLLDLSQPHDDGTGNVVFTDITASYEIWLQFDSSIKS